MKYNVVVLESFKNNFKTLQKKYRNIKKDFHKVAEQLKENPKAGISLNHNCYKLRVANSSIPTGKSGGYRIIYYFINNDNKIYLLAIYSKTRQNTISENRLLEILHDYGLM